MGAASRRGLVAPGVSGDASTVFSSVLCFCWVFVGVGAPFAWALPDLCGGPRPSAVVVEAGHGGLQFCCWVPAVASGGRRLRGGRLRGRAVVVVCVGVGVGESKGDFRQGSSGLVLFSGSCRSLFSRFGVWQLLPASEFRSHGLGRGLPRRLCVGCARLSLLRFLGSVFGG